MGARYIICECACACFCVRFCLYSFASTICSRVLSIHFFFGGVFSLNNYFFILITLLYFILLYFILLYLLSFFLPFLLPSFLPPSLLSFFLLLLILSFFLLFLPFILSHVDERLLVLQPGVSAVPLTWESQLQDTGPQETSQLHIIANGKYLTEKHTHTNSQKEEKGKKS